MMTDEIDDILAERADTHGDFLILAPIAQSLKGHMHECGNWNNLCYRHRESLDMIQHKIARILAGDPYHKDHWDDIAGYARLGSG